MGVKVSVVIPCFNYGAFIRETIASLAAPTFRDFEIVIVNDGSTDPATLEILRELRGASCRVIDTPNRGVSAARNLGIEQASGEYILPLDADDLISPDYLQRTVAALNAGSEVGVVMGARVMFGEKSGPAPLPPYDPRRELAENLIFPTALFRKRDWARVGGYCEAMRSGWEDWEYWVAFSRLGLGVVLVPEASFYYRVRSSSRDHSLTLWQKSGLFATIVWRHRDLYLRHFGYVAAHLTRHLLGLLRNRTRQVK